MKSSGRRRRLNAEINIVPYIDVMLVLLVIFMITAPLLTPGVHVNLPQAPAKPLKDSQKKNLTLSVDNKGRYYLNVGKKTDQPVSDKQIKALTAAMLRRNPHARVFVRGSKDVPYGRMIHAMVLLQQAGASSVGLVTKNPPDQNSG
jgi:biopolymer transport protein TolR